MDLQGLIERLNYAGDPGLLDPTRLNDCPPGIVHHLRRARETCGLQRAYALRQRDGGSVIPVIYLCDAADEKAARRVHHRVWNQNLVPFLVVSTPERFYLYSGFRYDGTDSDAITHIVKSAKMSLDAFTGLDASAIAEGRIWEQWGRYLNPARRVDWCLLKQLEELGQTLIRDQGLSRHQAHALIGKYIYLHYLRDRGILSDDKLRDWNIDCSQVFTREATVTAFTCVTERLEEWLNGSVFPIDLDLCANVDAAVRQTAAVLAGDRVDGQMHLDFRRYDFSHIPIETLSVIYQQFLHAEDQGRNKGAYYTPTFLVDLVLDEVATRRPLLPGVRVLDPACGSGAFLVQVYRRLIEHQLLAEGEDILSPARLSNLLTDHIFGIDQDEDACRVAAFSLSLTLLDYVEPPDLRRFPDFKLPELYGVNIVRGDFFAPAFPWPQSQFEWVVGNPPWVNLTPNRLLPDQEQAFAWMKSNRESHPIGGWQLAEAFLWKTLEHLRPEGAAGMIAPAMTLFKSQSARFRTAFFSQVPVWCAANFSNFAYLLFAERAALPAAMLFFRASGHSDYSEDILSYAPFAVNQPTLLQRPGRRFAWTLAINAGELRRVNRIAAARGDGLTWKLAMWGSPRDRRILERVTRHFPLFSNFRQTHNLLAHQGFQLRGPHAKDPVEFVSELVGKRLLKMSPLERRGRLYAFPASALDTVTKDNAYVRKRSGVNAPIQVCQPPHIVMPRNRRWAIYDNEFLVIPHPQLGIAGSPGQELLLKALALYLISDFATYHQLFCSAEMGVQMSVADLKTLESLPIPLDGLSIATLHQWAETYDALVECWHSSQEALFYNHEMDLPHIERHANELIYDALGLSEQERWLVEDLVYTRMALVKGKLGEESAAKRPTSDALEAYGIALRETLDNFAGRMSALRHRVAIWHSSPWGAVMIAPEAADATARIKVHSTSHDLDGELGELGMRLRREHTHWLYFERGLTIFEGDRVFLIKPMQHLHWLRSQALQDADNLIADVLAAS